MWTAQTECPEELCRSFPVGLESVGSPRHSTCRWGVGRGASSMTGVADGRADTDAWPRASGVAEAQSCPWPDVLERAVPPLALPASPGGPDACSLLINSPLNVRTWVSPFNKRHRVLCLQWHPFFNLFLGFMKLITATYVY